jgi:threonylcarbamoyladenosine tRNA methylthiotransferase MtaB
MPGTTAHPHTATPAVVTFGCRLNRVESDVMRRLAEDAGFVDAIIINTCTVTAEATRQARQAIRRAYRDHPGRPIVVTGCAAQVDAARFAAMPEVSAVWGNREKLEPATFRAAAQALAAGRSAEPAVAVGPSAALAETASHLIEHAWRDHAAGTIGDWTRAFVQIQQGCDHSCTFCIIPQARGPNRSVDPARIVDRVQTLVESGFAEIVLTGVDICSYGRDSMGAAPGLGDLVERLLVEVPLLKRLRLSSLDPAAIDERLIGAFADHARLMPHLHLSLQAGCDMILKRMKRRHRVADALRVCTDVLARRPDAIIGADLIAGFPTETDALFEETRRTVAALGVTLLHVFPYSPRPGTPAARMPQVASHIARARASQLRADGAARLAAYLAARIGSIAEVLIEAPGADGCVGGLSEHFVPVRLADGAPPLARGSIARVRITGTEAGRLIGKPA